MSGRARAVAAYVKLMQESAPTEEPVPPESDPNSMRHIGVVRVGDLRPSVAATLPGLYDRLGRAEGHWLGGLQWSTWVAATGVPSRRVASSAWALGVTEDGFPAAEVACPCSATPRVEALAPMAPCDGEGCPRHFFFDGAEVMAFYEALPEQVREHSAIVVPA